MRNVLLAVALLGAAIVPLPAIAAVPDHVAYHVDHQPVLVAPLVAPEHDRVVIAAPIAHRAVLAVLVDRPMPMLIAMPSRHAREAWPNFVGPAEVVHHLYAILDEVRAASRSTTVRIC